MRMMFDQLATAISDVAKNIGGRSRMTEKSIQNALKDVRRALLDADVNLDVADTLIQGVKKRSIGAEVTKGVTADQQFIKAMYDELLDMMGGDSSVQPTSGASSALPASTLAAGTVDNPSVILLAGLQGAGKTTAAGKLALYLKEREVDYDAVNAMGVEESSKLLTSRMPTRKRKVLLVAADVYRPAAISQLEILGDTVGVDVFSLGTDADPVDIAKQAVQKAKDEGYDTVLVDTAGRQVIDVDLMDELKRVKQEVSPDETLLVVDAMTGQEAASLTAAFDSAVGITGAILTKMDGDSRGGAAVSVRGVSGKPIKFVGTGEKTVDLEPFYPDRMASRILGMGDVISLVEKAAAEVSDADAEKMQKKMLEAKFDFEDFLKQTELVSKMGNFAGVAKMLPGIGGQLGNSQIREVEARLKRSKAMIQSMTKFERLDPELFIKDKTARSRILRISRGSGNSFENGVAFISEFQKMRTMMSRMQKQMGGTGGPNMDPAAAGPGDMPEMGNRRMRRNAKKNKGKARGGGRGFGA
jgi:signal recognition particle subunit SRP54